MAYLGNSVVVAPVTGADIVDGTITAADIEAGAITSTMVGLGNVDNTTDAAKPVSTAAQTALDLKATQSTTYTKTETDTAISDLVAAAPGALDTLNELAAALDDDANFATTITNSIATKSPIASPTFTGKVTADANILAAYSNTTAITGDAVDIFIYDTSKDSDGGAWRKRTQATSWYNETLNTSTRGSRKEFPAVAVIVAEASKVTIYDGDDPDMPMWMVGSNGSTNWVGGSGTFKSAVASNGIVSCSIGSSGCRNLHFINDQMSIFHTPSSGNYSQLGGIATRNDSFTAWTATDRYYKQIVNGTVNDIAITVLPNAPIDSATGLPIPTIAVATDGGVSVIKDDGTVINRDEAWSASGGGVHTISFDNTGGYWYTNAHYGPYTGNPSHAGILGHSPSINTTGNLATSLGNTYAELMLAMGSNDGGTSTHWSGTANPGLWMNHGGDSTQANAGPLHIMPHGDFANRFGLHKFLPNYATHSNSSVAYITSKYNTGFMTGDIRGAWNVDTDVTALSGTELVTNGDFGNGTTGWSAYAGGSNFSVVSGQLVTVDDCYQNITVVAGKAYVIDCDLISGTGANVYDSAGAVAPSLVYVRAATPTMTFIPSGSVVSVYIYTGTTIDNISVRLAIPDRSVKGSGLAVHGTPTVSAVATGAELKAISGFSASNYLEQPYNSDLDFGTGDFSISGWLKESANSANECVVFRGDSSANNYFQIYIMSDGTIRLRTANSSTGNNTLNPSNTIDDGSWHHVTMLRSSSTLSLYVDGISWGSISSTANISDPSDATLILGANVGSGNPLTNGSLALWRISATAPSAEQIKEIYEAEKVLFQANAKCTLNGSSDAVTALAFDDSTELLHVGTSGGRSVFQGLRRVDETSTSTTEIAAQGGLIVEET